MRVLYYLIIIPISYLPYRLLYFISNLLCFVVFRIIKYRKNIVFNNIKNSFPDMTVNEINIIMLRFYSHFCDLILESIRCFTISEEQIKDRLIIKNPEFTNKYAKENQDIILVGGHYNNWEIYGQGFSLFSNHICIGIYKPLSNKFMNSKIYKSRSKFGTRLIPMKKTKKSFEEKTIKPKMIVFGSDQNPTNPDKAYWLEFLKQDTAVAFGVEKYSKEYNLPVIFTTIRKKKRGVYEVEYSLITDKPKDEKYGEITTKFTNKLEEDIINRPEYWLWSHKRWKHKR